MKLRVVKMSESGESALLSQDIQIEGTPFRTSVLGWIGTAEALEPGKIIEVPDGVLTRVTRTSVAEDGTELSFDWFVPA